MKWHDVVVKGHGDVKLEREGKNVVAVLECPMCGRQRRWTFGPGTADALLGRLAAFRYAQHSPVETNMTESLKHTCCQKTLYGEIEFRIPDSLINKAKKLRFHGEWEGVYGGCLKISSKIKGATFPGDYFLTRDYEKNGLCYRCGRCGRSGFNYEVSVKFMEACELINDFFQGKNYDPKPVKINEKFACQGCGATLRIKAVLTPVIPEKGGLELLRAYKKWSRVREARGID